MIVAFVMSVGAARGDERVAWTTGKVTGSPEPPPPYQTVRAYPNEVFKKPVDVAFAGGRVFVVEEGGNIFSFKDDESATQNHPFFEGKRVTSFKDVPEATGVGSTYSIAFHPRYAENHFVFIEYNLNFKKAARNHERGSRVSRFMVQMNGDAPEVDYASEVVLIEWLSGGHNGCALRFGPKDGYLYISMGDAGDPNPPDPFNSGQDISDWLCSVHRIDVDHEEGGRHYAIPKDNPFVATEGARPEVFAYGLRNPWRIGFDNETGLLWVGDVGWELWESVYCCKAGTNCGWSIMEGPNPVYPNGKRGPTPITLPAATVSHAEAASMTGGFVYRGTKLTGLRGQYIFGDWQTRRIWAAKCDGDTLQPFHEIAMTDQRVVTFAESPGGDVIIGDHAGGGLWRLVPNDAVSQPLAFPRKLSETGIFTSAKDQTPAPGVYPFDINAPQWCDGATGQRWVAVPGNGSVDWGKGVWGDDKPAWPKDSVLVRTLSLELSAGDPASGKRIETQLLHFDGKQWQAYSYAWNEQQTDAELIPAKGEDHPIAIKDAASPGGVRKQSWHFASRAQCMTCHNVWDDYALAFNEMQLDRQGRVGEATGTEAELFKRLGLLIRPKPDKKADAGMAASKLVDPYDSSADVSERARSYLHVNCSSCHRFGGGGAALFDTRRELAIDKMNLVDAKPNLGGFGLDDPRLVCAGDPARSVLLYRTCKLGSGRMPLIGSNCVDDRGIALLAAWIAGMAPSPAGERAEAIRTTEAATANTPQAGAAIDRLLSSPSGALSLALELAGGKLKPPVTDLAATKGFSSPQQPIRDLFRRFDPAEQSKERLGTSIDVAKLLTLSGDPARGRKIFFEQNGTGLCARCHKLDNQGQDFGPDLAHIVAKYPKREDLLDNILNPSKTIAEGYTTYNVVTKGDETVSGFLVKQTAGKVVIKTAELKEVTIPSTSVKRMTAEKLSAMPEGLLADLEAQEAADLLAYLGTLK